LQIFHTDFQSSAGDGQRIAYRKPCDLNLFDQQGRLQSSSGANGCSDIDSALWLGAEPEPAFPCAFIDGVFSPKSNGQLRFHRINAPTSKELNALVGTISERVARYLERQGTPSLGWLARDEQSEHLTLPLEEGHEETLQQLQGHSITYRIAMGPHAGRKVLTLQTIPAREEEEYGTDRLGRIGGFSLHAGVSVNTRERKKLERICRGGRRRYISRPALSEARLELIDQGKVRYALKAAYRDGTTHVVSEPLDFMAKLAALVPRPRTNLTRFHGVLAAEQPRMVDGYCTRKRRVGAPG
jgi:hypothetical protein